MADSVAAGSTDEASRLVCQAFASTVDHARKAWCGRNHKTDKE